jgi:hypothetical protein
MTGETSQVPPIKDGLVFSVRSNNLVALELGHSIYTTGGAEMRVAAIKGRTLRETRFSSCFLVGVVSQASMPATLRMKRSLSGRGCVQSRPPFLHLCLPLLRHPKKI